MKKQAEIDNTLDQFKQKAKQEMERAIKEGNEEADLKWRIVTSNIEDIRQEDNFRRFIGLGPIYGQEEEKKRPARARTREAFNRRRDKLFRQLKRIYHNQRGQGRLFGRNLEDGLKNEKKLFRVKKLLLKKKKINNFAQICLQVVLHFFILNLNRIKGAPLAPSIPTP